MEQEPLVFGAFLALAAIGHLSHDKCHPPQLQGRLRCFRVIAWAGAALTHPVFVHTIKDYAIHFVVYSGYVIGSH